MELQVEMVVMLALEQEVDLAEEVEMVELDVEEVLEPEVRPGVAFSLLVVGREELTSLQL